VKYPARLRWLWLTMSAVILDRATKAWFDAQTGVAMPHEVIRHYLYLVHTRNPGIAFSFFSDSNSAWTRILLITGSLAVIGALAWFLLAGHGGTLSAAGIALLLGGATGNVTDRITHGAVTDFLEVWLPFLPWRIFNPWPAFNVADSAITIGAILVIVDLLSGSRPGHEISKTTD
jgi:signal peptidase II